MIAQFAILLTLGMSLMWALMPRSQVTSGFFRIQMLIAMALSVLALLTLGQLTSRTGQQGDQLLLFARVCAGLSALMGYVGSVFWMLNRRSAGTFCTFSILILSVLCLVFCCGGVEAVSTTSGIFLLASHVATAAVLGGAVTGMLLGHWYLTAPTMSIEPLKQLSWLFGGAVFLRLVVSITGWLLAGNILAGGTIWTWFALRWLAGIICPLVIAMMSLQILRYRNTQAATGVLFAGVILTFIGEMSAALLYYELHVPL